MLKNLQNPFSKEYKQKMERESLLNKKNINTSKKDNKFHHKTSASSSSVQINILSIGLLDKSSNTLNNNSISMSDKKTDKDTNTSSFTEKVILLLNTITNTITYFLTHHK